MEKKQIYIGLAVIVVVIIAGVAIFWSQGGQAAPAADPVTSAELKTLRVGYLPNNGGTLIFVAQEKGFFREQGLNVELSSFTNSAEGVNAIISKKLDTGGFGVAPLVFIAKGADLTVYGGQMGAGAGIIVKPENAQLYNDLSDYKGKTVATVRMSSGDINFRGALLDAGFDLKKDITIQELESAAAVTEAVKSGKVDVGLTWTPYMEIAKKQNLPVVLYTDDYFPKHPCCRISALTETLEKDRDTYVKYEKALIKAYHYSKTNPEETVDAVLKYVQTDRDVLTEAINSPHFYISPDPNTKGILHTYDLLTRIKYVDTTTVDVNDHINTSIYKEALDELIRENPNETFYQELKAEFATLNPS
ncbi:ABC transporter substrate-binding protein [Methanoculleus palmolei]|jgi:NitT/TauT family transport system substrate-binding protein|uniref:ABC transporter substrate-binding protein n=1 Tax=Methanoculleus palmolei TaxID=72612 RepID=A0ABD8A935_9EURY|nr:ABC transporter substrate-binding protein [Methanoculleus sp. UBA377]WOX55635.1 ABC transporter substrate-binding protein [Methanoculleus palmolei]